MILETLVFYMLAALIIFSAIGVVTLRNLFRCAIMLVLVFIGVAGLYFMLNAPFIAVVQILIYVGAITVLLLFAIMLTKKISDNLIKQTNEQVLANTVIVILFVIVLSAAAVKFLWATKLVSQKIDSISMIGRLLLTDYLMPFEVISVILLVALIGAIVMAKKD